MRLVLTGVTRIVILIGPYAIKIPRLNYGWRMLLWGLIGNISEKTFSDTKWKELCPVLLSFPGGFLNVMRRAEPVPYKLTKKAMWAFREGCDYMVPAELKQDSFGILDGKLVVVDYGDTRL